VVTTAIVARAASPFAPAFPYANGSFQSSVHARPPLLPAVPPRCFPVSRSVPLARLQGPGEIAASTPPPPPPSAVHGFREARASPWFADRLPGRMTELRRVMGAINRDAQGRGPMQWIVLTATCALVAPALSRRGGRAHRSRVISTRHMLILVFLPWVYRAGYAAISNEHPLFVFRVLIAPADQQRFTIS